MYTSYACSLVAFSWPRWSAGSGAQSEDHFGVLKAVVNTTSYSYMRDCHDHASGGALAVLTAAHLEIVCGKAVTACIALMSLVTLAGLGSIVFSSKVAAEERSSLQGRPAYLVFAGLGAGISCGAQICAMLLWMYVGRRIRASPAPQGYDVGLGAAFYVLVVAWLLAAAATAGFFLVPPAGVDDADMYAALAQAGDGDAMFMGDSLYDYDEQLALDGDAAGSQATEL